jgi:(p)ppGpp synthase/HD superfamily hydrolase
MRPLAHRLGIYTIKWELEDLAFHYMEPEIYYNLVEQVKVKRREREAMINDAMNILGSTWRKCLSNVRFRAVRRIFTVSIKR